MEFLTAQTLQQELKADLMEAQTALKEWGEGKNDDDITVQDFEEMIKDDLDEEGILPTPERIQAVAGWAVITVQDSGVHLSTAIGESVACSINELENDYA